jgi:hypothetical protein
MALLIENSREKTSTHKRAEDSTRARGRTSEEFGAGRIANESEEYVLNAI